jgi:hypothetical protein
MSAEWIPKIGEKVVVPITRGTLTRLKRTGTVVTVAPPFVRVFIEYGRAKANLPFLIADLQRTRESR